MPKVHYVKKARKDYPGIKKGQSYYWFKLYKRSKVRQLTRPKRWQLTGSYFLSEVWQLEDEYEFDFEDLETSVEELVNQLESLLDECEANFSNMPDSLQYESETGQMLEERIDGLTEWIDNLRSVDLEYDIEKDWAEWAEETEAELRGCHPGVF